MLFGLQVQHLLAVVFSLIGKCCNQFLKNLRGDTWAQKELLKVPSAKLQVCD